MRGWTPLLVFVAACGFPRPADVVACTPGEFSECRGDAELTCNANGAGYDAVQCARGCDANIGCRLCDANQTVCTNGKVQTCDAAGAITSSESCPLGCFEDQPRCREIDPSNGLGKYLDMVADPPDLNLTDARVDTQSGEVRNGGATGPIVTVPNFAVQEVPGGAAIRVFVARTVRISGGLVVTVSSRILYGGPAIAIVARGDITILGSLIVSSSAGGVTGPDACLGGFGKTSGVQDPNTGDTVGALATGGGGGGHATDGAEGGNLTFASSPPLQGGIKGGAAGNADLVPLRGGCPGGFGLDLEQRQVEPHGGPGGGAIQLSSRTSIHVDDAISVVGHDGDFERFDQLGLAVSGGGAGGGILVEAPYVEFGPAARLLATGGNGGSCQGESAVCASGGAGATAGRSANPGNDAMGSSGPVVTSGGGGGGLGRIRVNTVDGHYTKSNSAIEDASVSTGVLATR